MTDPAAETAQPESHDSDGAQSKPGFLWFFWLVMALLLGYPLSLGPVAKYYDTRKVPSSVIAFYHPLEILYHKSSTVHGTVDWYLHIWGAR